MNDASKNGGHPWRDVFQHFARSASQYLGSSWSFLIACVIVFVWACTGPLFGFSDTWQIVINTATTIVTFLMVFLIQNAQNHDAQAMQLKLDELLRAVEAARTGLVNLEDRSEDDLQELKKELCSLRDDDDECQDESSGQGPAGERR